MTTRQAERPETHRETSRASIAPAVRLVDGFADAVDSSRPGRALNDEAFLVEGLLIAADSTAVALARSAALWFDANYGDEPTDEAGDEQVVLDGYAAWLDAARSLRDRLAALEAKGYESAAGGRLASSIREAESILDAARSRRQLERDALTNEQLAELARDGLLAADPA